MAWNVLNFCQVCFLDIFYDVTYVSNPGLSVDVDFKFIFLLSAETAEC